MKLPNSYGSVIRSGRHYLGTFRTRQEALNALAYFKQNLFDVDLRKLTFAEVYALWSRCKFKDAPIKPVYVATYKNLSALHDLTFSALLKRHIQAVIDACPLKVQAKGHMKSVCTQMYRYANDMAIVATNYASLVELPVKEDSELHKPFSKEELAELWQHTDDLGAKVALILCYTGLRPSELAKMKTADVHLPERYMQGGLKMKASKNRVIPIAEKIFPLVEWLYEPANNYLLALEGTAVLSGQNLRLKIRDKSPLLKGHLPHDGRHTCDTLIGRRRNPVED